jgi:hypothetical protein
MLNRVALYAMAQTALIQHDDAPIFEIGSNNTNPAG